MTDNIVHGTTQDRFAPVRDVMAKSLKSGADLGASFCATIDGETVIDIWGGWADEAKTRPWEADTIVNVYSTTKTMTALTALLLADRGALDFEAPVAKYWPEFAQNGKDNITTAQLMSHSSGLSGWEEKISVDDLYDWEKVTSLLAAQAPWWEPGSQPGYHAITQGYLVGEVVRRITGKSLGTVFREEIAKPLDADFHIGLPPEHDHRVADLIPPVVGAAQAAANDIQRKTFTNPPINPLDTRTREWRGAEIPAAGGTGNARSVAEIHAMLANGGVAKGKRFLSEAGCRKALELQSEGNDLVLLGLPLKFGLGFGLTGEVVQLPNANSMFWGGYGGPQIIIDMANRMTCCYVMNKMGDGLLGDMRSADLIGMVRAVLG